MSISRKTKDGEIFTVRHFVHRLVWSLNKKKKKEKNGNWGRKKKNRGMIGSFSSKLIS